MPTRLTKDLNKEVRCSVDNLRLTGKFRNRIDVAGNPNTPTYAIEVAVQSVPSLRNQIQSAKARCLLTFFHRKVAPELADESPLTIPLRKLAGEEEQVSRVNERHVVRPGRTWSGKLNTQQPKALVDQ
jgi:hypothetical protein